MLLHNSSFLIKFHTCPHLHCMFYSSLEEFFVLFCFSKKTHSLSKQTYACVKKWNAKKCIAFLYVTFFCGSYFKSLRPYFYKSHNMDRVKRIWYLSPMRAAKVQASLRIRAVSPEPSLLANTSSESRGTFWQKARSLAPLNGLACAVEICHDGMLEDTNSLDRAHIMKMKFSVSHYFVNRMYFWITLCVLFVCFSVMFCLIVKWAISWDYGTFHPL